MIFLGSHEVMHYKLPILTYQHNEYSHEPFHKTVEVMSWWLCIGHSLVFHDSILFINFDIVVEQLHSKQTENEYYNKKQHEEG